MKSDYDTHDAATTTDPIRRVTLVRGRHHWTLECQRGDEQHLLRLVSDYATVPDYPLDRFDAAVISHQLCGIPVAGLNKVPDKAD